MSDNRYHQRTGINVRGALTIAFRILTVMIFLSGTVGLLQYRRDLQSAAWPSVQGIVLHSQTQPCHFRGEPIGLLPDIAYTYTVNGREWVGTRLDRKSHCASADVVRSYVAKFPVRSQVLVFYNSSSPAESLLHPGPGREQIDLFHLAEIQIGLSVLLALFFVWDSYR